MDKKRLEALYQYIESAKILKREVSEADLAEIAELEEELLKEEILPILNNEVSQVLQQIRRELLFVVEYKPDEPISVRVSHTNDLTDLSDLTSLTADVIPDIVRRSHQTRKGEKAPASRLRITMEDGRVICYPKNAAKTFGETINAIGLAQVRALNIMPSGVNLVSTTKDENRQQYQIGDYFIFTNSSTKDKVKILNEIADRLRIRIKVEVI